MQFTTTVLFFILAIAPLVVIHELGHYAVGRWCGVKAEVFSVGFGRALAHWTDRRGTRWQIAAIPLGGYVRFAGDMSAAGGTDPAWLSLPADERNRTFQAKTVAQRAAIVLAGPLTNFAFAVLMLAALFSLYGEPRTAPEVGGFAVGAPAQAAGMRIGDRIVRVEGQAVSQFEDIGLIVQVRAGQPTRFVVERGGARLAMTVTPQRVVARDFTGGSAPVGRIGIASVHVDHIRLAAWQLPGAALRFTGQSVRTMAVALGQIVSGQRSVHELGGPVRLAVVSNAMARAGLAEFLFFMAMVSINLGFINLLPIPTLDGGHLAFYAVEAVRRRQVSQVAQDWAYRGGLVALLAFMLFVTLNDVAGLGLLGGLPG